MDAHVAILDNTLREGEQVPGVWFTRDEKRTLFRALLDAGVDIVDAGIPATSAEDADFCRECAALAGTGAVGVTVRAVREEIDLAASIGAGSVFLMFPFSEIHIEHKFATTPAAIKKRCEQLVAYAHTQGLEVNLVAEDASRGTVPLVCDLADFAAHAGIERLFVCDTVGAALPTRFSQLIEEVVRAASGRCQTGVHCHNDFGLATANTLAAVEAGAEIVSVTVNGLGERAGNAPLHEVALSLSLLAGRKHGIDPRQLPRLSELAEKASGMFLSPLTPIVGRNAFRHESGIHVDGLLKASRVYEELAPEIVGRTRELVLGKSTGTHYLRALLHGTAYPSDDAFLRRLLDRVRQEALAHDKSAARRLHASLDAHYRDNFGFPLSRFWELAAEIAREKTS